MQEVPTPLWDPIHSFSHKFSLKIASIRCWHPPPLGCPPQREILDQPLSAISQRWCKGYKQGWGDNNHRWGANLQRRRFLAKTYVKIKELGLVRGEGVCYNKTIEGLLVVNIVQRDKRSFAGCRYLLLANFSF